MSTTVIETQGLFEQMLANAVHEAHREAQRRNVENMTEDQVKATILFAAEQALTEDVDHWRRWLAFALESDFPINYFNSVCIALDEYEANKTCDLEHWFEMVNTHENRQRVLDVSDQNVNFALNTLTSIIRGR